MKGRWIPLFQIGNIVAAVSTIIINILANVIPIGGNYTADVSDSIPNLFVPAGITFSIWGIIYILIIMFSIYLARDIGKERKTTTTFIEKISYFFILAGIANISWIFLWHYQQIILSLIAMLILFIALVLIYLRLNIGIASVSMSEKVFIHIPISVYLGWITVAMIANVTAVLVTVEWDGFGISHELWTMMIIAITVILTIIILFTRRDYAYCAVIIWALTGIYIKRSSSDPIYGIQNQIASTAIFGIIILIIIAVFIYIKRYMKNATRIKQ